MMRLRRMVGRSVPELGARLSRANIRLTSPPSLLAECIESIACSVMLSSRGSVLGPDDGVPVFDIRKTAGMTDMLIGTPALGRALAGVLGTKSAALMRGHGAVVAAVSLHLVVGQAYYLNLNARLQLQAIQLAAGNVTYLDSEEAKKASQDYERSWEFWKSRLPRR